MKFSLYILKRTIEDILMWPFIFIGRLFGISTKSNEYDIYFFFPFYHTGGAEKVHLQIAKAFGQSKKCIIFFTRRSVDERFLEEFKDSGCEVKDISQYTDNKLLYFVNIIWRGRMSQMINRQANKPIVFNGQCNFGYKISPWIRKDIKQVELIHSFNTFSWIRLPFLPFISNTIMISKLRIEEHLKQYRQLNVPSEYDERIQFIQNAVELPKQACEKNYASPLKVLFVGRGTPEKRPELFIGIAKAAQSSGIVAEFTLAGEMNEEIIKSLPSNSQSIGNVNDPAILHKVYCNHHILIIPSSTEGFPIVLMEAMARGCAIMATPVGDIPYHINNTNGLLYSSVEAAAVINESIAFLGSIDENKLRQLSNAAITHAFKNFDILTFNQQYQTILQP